MPRVYIIGWKIYYLGLFPAYGIHDCDPRDLRNSFHPFFRPFVQLKAVYNEHRT